MVVDFDQSAIGGSEDCLPKSKGISRIRLDVVIITQEDPSYVVLSKMGKGLEVLQSCCISLTRHLAMKVEFVYSPMRMALGM